MVRYSEVVSSVLRLPSVNALFPRGEERLCCFSDLFQELATVRLPTPDLFSRRLQLRVDEAQELHSLHGTLIHVFERVTYQATVPPSELYNLLLLIAQPLGSNADSRFQGFAEQAKLFSELLSRNEENGDLPEADAFREINALQRKWVRATGHHFMLLFSFRQIHRNPRALSLLRRDLSFPDTWNKIYLVGQAFVKAFTERDGLSQYISGELRARFEERLGELANFLDTTIADQTSVFGCVPRPPFSPNSSIVTWSLQGLAVFVVRNIDFMLPLCQGVEYLAGELPGVLLAFVLEQIRVFLSDSVVEEIDLRIDELASERLISLRDLQEMFGRELAPEADPALGMSGLPTDVLWSTAVEVLHCWQFSSPQTHDLQGYNMRGRLPIRRATPQSPGHNRPRVPGQPRFSRRLFATDL